MRGVSPSRGVIADCAPHWYNMPFGVQRERGKRGRGCLVAAAVKRYLINVGTCLHAGMKVSF